MSLSRTGNNLYVVCTSGTRPSAPSEGTLIYETDTNLQLIYDGSDWVTISPVSAVNDTVEGYTGTDVYGDANTPGPAVTVQTGASVLLTVSAYMQGSVSTDYQWASAAVSGATTLAASDSWALRMQPGGSFTIGAVSKTHRIDGLTPGVNTFTMKYKNNGGTRTCGYRTISVVGIP
jgi:hypothetical protein